MAPGTWPEANSSGVRTSTTFAPEATSAFAVGAVDHPGLDGAEAADGASGGLGQSREGRGEEEGGEAIFMAERSFRATRASPI